MSGLSFHIISEITRNLRDRYDSGFPVLKELVQNANDARAKNFIFGHHPGFGESHKHPLITGPALWFFNDGNFEIKDIKNIQSFGINSKAGEASTIGKFGLGMKSVFHLVEAFLYLGKPSNKNFCREIINPWDDKEPDHLHCDWNIVEDTDWKALENFVKEQLNIQESQSGFFLWLPLRTEALLAGKGPIIARYPGDPKSNELAFLEEREIGSKLAAVLAMLPHLERITYHRDKGGFNLSVVTASNQNRLTLACDEVVSKEPVYVVEGFGNKLCVAAKHFPAINSDTKFSNFKNSKAWPKSFFRNLEGKEELTPDKSRPEGAVVISHTDGTAGKLQVEWAVFLPLESHAIEVVIPQTSRHYRITLHGQYFVDAGRKGIFGFDDWFKHNTALHDDFDESSLRRAWNMALTESIVLPLLLPALEHYCQAWNLSSEEIESLTKAIGEWIKKISSKTGAVVSLRQTVCKPGAWVKALTPKGAIWTVKPDSTRLLPIPLPPKYDKSRPWQIFPVLEKLGCAIDANASFIAQDGILQWSEQEILSCIESVKVIDSFSQKGLDYIAEWLEMGLKNLPFLESQTIKSALVKKIREGFQHHGLKKVRGFSKSLARVLKFLYVDNCIGLGSFDKNSSSAINEAVFQALWKCDSDQLLVPNEFLVEKTSNQPADANLIGWLSILHTLVIQEEHANSAMTAAQNLLELLESKKRKEVLSMHKDFRVIRAKDVRTGKDVSLSFNQLRTAFDKHSLFSANTANISGSQHLKFLAEVLPEQSIFQLTKELKESVFDSNEKLPAHGDSTAILLCILKSDSQIGHFDVRKKLVGVLNLDDYHETMLDEAKIALRYLVHGVKEYRYSKETLWLRDDATDVVWEKLWSTILKIPSWQIVDPSIVEELKQGIVKKLDIKEIDLANVIQKIENDSGAFDLLCEQKLNKEEQEEILCKVKNEDLWKRLPFHQFTDGKSGPIDNVFRTGNIKLPTSLTTQAKFIVISNKKDLQAIQKEWIPELSHGELAKLALKSDKPSQHWGLILEAMDKSEDEFDDFIDISYKSVWIPLQNGESVAPSRILYVEGMNDEIVRLNSEAGNQFATLDRIHIDFQNHRNFIKYKNKILPSGKMAFSIILNAMGEVSRYSVGLFPEKQSELINEALPELKDIIKLPGWTLITKAAEQLNLAVADVLAGQKMKPLCAEILVEILNELAQTEPLKNTLRYKAHLLYLHSLNIDSNCNSNHIKELKLLTQSGHWKPAEQLCAGVSGVPASYLIDTDQQQALHACIHVSNLAAHDEAINAVEDASFRTLNDQAEKNAREYFGKLASRAGDPAIGCFLAIMGDRYKNLAQSYLKNKFTVPSIREKLAGNELDKNQSSNILLESINTAKIVISQITDAKVKTANLLGNLTSFPVEATPETLLIGTPNWIKFRDQAALKVQFPNIDTLKQLNSPEIKALLKRTAQDFMRVIHKDKHDHVSLLWSEINRSDQLDIEIVRRKILDNLPSYLEQLGAHRQSPIKERYDLFTKADETYITASCGKDNLSISEVKRQRDKRVGLLADCIVENKQAHQIILDQIRRRIQGFDYAADAVLFELFQNADDAGVELARCEADGNDHFEIPQPSKRLVIYKDQSIIRLMHWGRLINYRPPNITDKWYGFGDDLKKMLILNSSDKPDDKSVTGRFGLGFKSVFLVCDKPRIISGDLIIEICGSILPVPWRASNKANDLLNKYTKDRVYPGTLIELDITHGIVKDVLQRFELNSGLLTVFSRAIRHIQIDSDNSSFEFLWKPIIIDDDLNIEIGRTRLSGMKSDPSNLLVVRTEEGSIALKLGASGAEIIDSKICPIWVTAPTRESDKIGFVVNGSFNIDAGRGRLAGIPKANLEHLKKIGNSVGQQLTKICQNAIDDSTYWKNLQNALGIVKECTLPEFWNTIWYVLCKHTVVSAESELAKMVKELVCAAFNKWVDSDVSFPNGLSGRHAQFIKFDVKLVQIDDKWNDGAILDCIALFSKYHLAEYVIVSSVVANLLQTSGRKTKVIPLTLDFLFRTACEQSGYKFTSQIAEEFQALLVEFDAKKINNELSQDEKDKILFLTASKQWMPARSILCKADLQEFIDENRRYEFAPDAHRLDSSYSKDSTAFFVRCRGNMCAPAEELAKWVLEADETVRIAALNYIADGDLANPVADLIRGKGWVADISPQSKYLNSFNQNQKNKILRALAAQEKITQSWISDRNIEAENLTLIDLQRERALRAINEWWKREGTESLKQYDRKFWPAEVPRKFAGIHENRTSWMTLFALALMRRIGFATDSKNRNFIELMQEKGWWDIFCSSDPRTQGQDWLEVLREYGEGQTQSESYSLWMDNFPRIYRIANWLDVYVQVFRSLDCREEWQTGEFLSPSADHVMSGFDPAPTIHSSLKLGQHIVVRELLRWGELKSDTAKQLAYMPSARIKKLFGLIGYPELTEKDVQSKEIYDVLHKTLKSDATFKNAFDIPLIILAGDSSLQAKILGVSMDQSIDLDDE